MNTFLLPSLIVWYLSLCTDHQCKRKMQKERDHSLAQHYFSLSFELVFLISCLMPDEIS